MSVKYGSLPFKEQISFFQNKLNIPTERWADIWRDGHNSGFMIAGAMKNDLLNDFRQAVDMAIAEGKSISWFKKEFQNIKARHGWSHYGDEAWRSKVIYDTNMRQSYNAGRYEQLQHFEYWEYQHGDSRQPRELHLKWHGTLLPKDDPWWQTHFPSNGWGCKCRVRGRSQSYVDRKKLTPGKAPKDGARLWVDKVTGEEHTIPKGIDPGFDYLPKKGEAIKRQKKITKQKAKAYIPPPRIAPTAFSTTRGADVHALNEALATFEPAKKQLEKLGKFLAKHDIKTLFLKQAEMGARNKASLALVTQLQNYLNIDRYVRHYFTDNKPARVNGFTFANQSHVVVKVSGSTRFTKAEFGDLKEAVDDAILLYREGNQQFSLSSIVRRSSNSGDHGGAIVTWLHEMGHQVHFKAGLPYQPVPVGNSITRYGNTNFKEWHAEHFAMWVLNREALAQWDEGIAVYFDKLIGSVIE